MPNIKQATKRVRQAEGRRERNKHYRSMMRTYIKRVHRAIRSGDKSGAQAAFRAAVPVIDRVAGKGIVAKNKAARHKSRLNAHIRQMGG